MRMQLTVAGLWLTAGAVYREFKLLLSIYGHRTEKIPHPVRSAKSSSVPLG